mmetsp:Transcript_14477/g.43486  ORF Transcript_14477/g.43486 Transcript_14477/m.43486 type:complete len:229 (-) Transcript_14477:1179-1865(-)
MTASLSTSPPMSKPTPLPVEPSPSRIASCVIASPNVFVRARSSSSNMGLSRWLSRTRALFSTAASRAMTSWSRICFASEKEPTAAAASSFCRCCRSSTGAKATSSRLRSSAASTRFVSLCTMVWKSARVPTWNSSRTSRIALHLSMRSSDTSNAPSKSCATLCSTSLRSSPCAAVAVAACASSALRSTRRSPFMSAACSMRWLGRSWGSMGKTRSTSSTRSACVSSAS